jgi:predicted small lipoprotein YifL
MNGKHDRASRGPGLCAGILAASLLFAGCGQRGPLYLPSTPASPAAQPPRGTAPTATTPAAAQAAPGATTDARIDDEGARRP